MNKMNNKILNIILLLIVSSSALFSQKEKLRWAADAEGNAPFIFQDPKIPSKIIGFEVDIAAELAKELNMEPVFVQNQWDGLIPGLYRGDYDVAINGLEITNDRKAEVLFSDPYYITYEQIVVLNSIDNIAKLTDLIGKKVGALKNSLAERIIQEQEGINVFSYEGEVNAFTDMENGRLDAVLADYPIALYHASWNPTLKLVGQPVGEVVYGIAMRKQDSALQTKINKALDKLVKNGKLREIYERWNLWSYAMALHFNDHSQSDIEPSEFKRFLDAQSTELGIKEKLQRYIGFLPVIGEAALTTLAISVLAMLLAILLGLVIALIRLYAPQPFSGLAQLYIEIIRGTPLLIQLYFIFYAAPTIGIKLSPFLAAIIGLGMNYAAYEAENYRAGLLSVPRGQMEAAISLGMSRRQSLRFIIIPQAIRLVIPPITNDFISLLKDSSLVSLITMVELTKKYFQLATTYYDFFGFGLLIAIVYLILGLPFVRLARLVEKKYAIDKRNIPQ